MRLHRLPELIFCLNTTIPWMIPPAPSFDLSFHSSQMVASTWLITTILAVQVKSCSLGIETEKGPVGLLDTHKSFFVSHFLFLGNNLQPPWPSLSSKGSAQTAVNQGREGMQRPGRSSQETIVKPYCRVLVLLQGIYITISLSSSAELKPPTKENQEEDYQMGPLNTSFEVEYKPASTLILLCGPIFHSQAIKHFLISPKGGTTL